MMDEGSWDFNTLYGNSKMPLFLNLILLDISLIVNSEKVVVRKI